MGLSKLLFGFDKKDLEKLQENLNKVEKENKQLRQIIENTIKELEKLSETIRVLLRETEKLEHSINLEKKKTENNRELLELHDWWITEIINIIREKYLVIASSETSTEQQDLIQNKAIVLLKISSGYNTISTLLKETGLSKSKLYAILKSLVEEGIIEKQRDGRKVKYILKNPQKIQKYPGENTTIET